MKTMLTVAGFVGIATSLLAAVSPPQLEEGTVICERHAAGARFDFQCWASDGLTNGEGAVYVFLEFSAGAVRSTLLNGAVRLPDPRFNLHG